MYVAPLCPFCLSAVCVGRARCVRRSVRPMWCLVPLLGLGAWRPLWVLLAVVFVVVGLSREFFPITRVRIGLCLASGWVCVGYLCGGPALALCVGGCVFRVVVAFCTEASPKPSLGWVSCLCVTRVVLAYVRGCLHVDSGSNLLLLRVDGCGPALALTQVCRSLVVSSYTVAHVGSFPLL